MTTASVRLSTAGPGIGLIEIDAPPTNALGESLRRQFSDHLGTIDADNAMRVIVVTGSGTSFCSGDDLKEREAIRRGDRTETALSFVHLFDRIEASRVPVIAAVNGWAAGGGLELALACDIRLASERAKFVCAAVNIGLIASAWRLPRLIGVGPAKHLLLTGSPCDAVQAERLGLVTGVHAAGDLRAAALTLAARIASRAPLSVEATRRIASRALDLEPAQAAAAIEREFAILIKSEDHAEALAAFREKREPLFHRR